MILGVVRNLDQNGRVQIPIEMREKLNLDRDLPLNVYEENGKIIISPVSPVVRKMCVVCGVIEVRTDREVCTRCMNRKGIFG